MIRRNPMESPATTHRQLDGSAPRESDPEGRTGEGLSRRAKLILVGSSLALLTLAHFTTPAHLTSVHDFLFKATYLPLILAGLWLGLQGAALFSGLTAGLYLVHIFGQLAAAGSPTWPILADVSLFTIMSFTAGALSDRREAALRDAERKAAELKDTTRVLLRAEEELRRAERLRSLGELAAGLAHEIRNPLGGIQGAGEILARESTDAESRAEFREVLRSEISRLDRTVEAFLEFARPTEGVAETLDLRQEVEHVFLLLLGRAKDSGVELVNDIPPEFELRADPDLLRQVLLNLSLNGIQAMEGGGTLRATPLPDRATGLRIEDTGEGIPEEVRDRLFEPFVTLRPGGTGLGLATSARLLDTMGGLVRVHASGPGGTAMEVRFDG